MQEEINPDNPIFDTETPGPVPEKSLRQRLASPIVDVEIDLDEKLTCGFSRKEIVQMKSAGMQKPDMIPWDDWFGPKKMSHRHMLLCHLSALGYPAKDIATATGMDEGTVYRLLRVPAFKVQIKIVREVEMQGMGVPQKIDQLSSQAMRVYEEILFSPATKMSLKQKTAQDVLDRKVGKPNQKIEHTGSLLKELYATLKEQDRAAEAQKVINIPQIDFSDPAFAPDFAEEKPSAEPLKDVLPITPLVDDWLGRNT